MPSVAIVYHSGYGHTKVLAERVHKGASSVEGVDAHLINTQEMGDSEWQTLDDATAIIFGSPTYMGTASAGFSEFKDATSKRWMEGKWKNKLAAGFTNSGSLTGEKQSTLIQMQGLAAQHMMVWISLGLMPGNNSSTGSSDDLNRLGSAIGAMAQSNVDEGPDACPPESDRLTGEHLGKRVAAFSKTWSPPADI
ncbi:flavodoxin family protein [Acuticoccus sp. MNP-M23]|uniref:flavodoxin family protein n=1 Tax=Acuticoccus sp. MNP-M23 TaxID=3072793 RepID=UPI002815B590|nr:flavodoxin family protein [Acuticoccus sp. MNP-M23]WMS40989.1 flavodoxin family protein [Acuticoccus sp. MNP-M23]